MKILVAIANYGETNNEHARRLIREYRGMPFDCHVAVLSNIPKDYGPDVEVVVGMPAKNTWSLPFLHKKLFFDRKEEYDLYIYSEDDTLITEGNIRAFLESDELLDEDEVPGFMRYEFTPAREKFVSTVHTCFHWLPETVKKRGGRVFARFTNDHSACFLLTRKQLQAAIRSGGFMVEPHEGLYDMLCSAATDPYTRCGLKKYVCISDIDTFLLPHMTDKYIGRLGIPYGKFLLQIERMLSMAEDGRRFERLYPREPSLPTFRFHKVFYGELVDVTGYVPGSARRVLSVGCGSGDAEKRLADSGREVTAIPLDHVMATMAAEKGVRLLPPTLEGARKELSGERFDCILFADVLQHLEKPGDVLASFFEHLAPGGRLLVANRNCGIPWRFKYFVKKEFPSFLDIRYERDGIHPVTPGALEKWLKPLRASGTRVERVKEGKGFVNGMVHSHVIATCVK